jgi:hypothetical protein
MVLVYLKKWNGDGVKVVYGERDNGCDQHMSQEWLIFYRSVLRVWSFSPNTAKHVLS